LLLFFKKEALAFFLLKGAFRHKAFAAKEGRKDP
jgi:hypothetical protein